MKAIPMLFQTELVRALLDGRKTVTRRPVNEKNHEHIRFMGSSDDECSNLEFLGLNYAQWKDEKKQTRGPEYLVYCTEYPEEGIVPIGQGPARKGDLIYVRETWREYSNTDECGCSDHCACPPNGTPLYFATHNDGESKWKPSIHMPRKHSRLTLKVTDVRIERLQDITEEQAQSEGFRFHSLYKEWGGLEAHPDSRAHAPQWRWYEKASHAFKYLWNNIYNNWDQNPYVWVIEFEVIHKNVDQVISEMEAA